METMWLMPRNPKRMETSLASVPMVPVGMVYTLHCLIMAGVVEPVLLFGEILAAAAGADDHADAAQFVARHRVDVEPGIRQRLGDAGSRQRDGARNVRPVLDLHVLLLVELIGHLAGYLHLVSRTGSKRVIRRTPLTPFRVASQKRSRPIPFGLTAPIPVMTTRRMDFTLPLVFSSV